MKAIKFCLKINLFFLVVLIYGGSPTSVSAASLCQAIFDEPQHIELSKEFKKSVLDLKQKIQKVDFLPYHDKALLEEVPGSMAHYMYFLDESWNNDFEPIGQLHEIFKNRFGQNLRAEDWPYNFDKYGLKLLLPKNWSNYNYLKTYNDDGMIRMLFKIYNSNNQVVGQLRRSWLLTSKNFDIHNDLVVLDADVRGGQAPLGSYINKSQIEFIKKYSPKQGRILVHATLNVGGYNWANQGFEFSTKEQLRNFRRKFDRYLREVHNIRLSWLELRAFTLPAHFASFDTGKTIVREVTTHAKLQGKTNGPLNLNAKQLKAGTLSGDLDGVKLTDTEITSGTTYRVEVHIGKDFMLGSDWHGVFKSENMVDENEGYSYFMYYDMMGKDASRFFNEYIKKVLKKYKGLNHD